MLLLIILLILSRKKLWSQKYKNFLEYGKIGY